MHRPQTPAIAAALVLAALALPSSAAAQRGKLEDEAHGFSISPPSGWAQLPAHGDRGQALAVWVGERVLPSREGLGHAPTFKVLQLTGGDDKSGDEVDGIPRKTPFRSHEDYLKRAFGADATIEDREALDGDVKGMRFQAKVALPGGAHTVFGVELAGDDGPLLAVGEVLSEHADKEAGAILKALASFERIDRKGDGASVAAPWKKGDSGWSEASVADRRLKLKDFAEACVAKAAASPENGWKDYRSKHWTVLSNAKSGDVKKVLTAADAARAWCEENLAGIGGGAAPAVLRIYAEPHHLATVNATQWGARDYDPDTRTLHFALDPSDRSGGSYGALIRAVIWHWIDDQAPGAMRAAPRWFDNGLWEYCRSTRVKGRKIEFSAGDVENGRFDYHARNDSLPPLWGLIQESSQPSPENGANEDPWGYTPECARLMRWFFEHDGSKAFGKDDFVADYVKGIAEAVREVGADPTNDIVWSQLDEQEATAARKIQFAWRDRALVRTNDIAIPLQPEAWQKANEQWIAFVKDF